MHLTLTLDPFVDSDLLYAQQLGVCRIIGDLSRWDLETLGAARNRVEQAGLTLCGLGSLPTSLVATAISGHPKADEAAEQVGRTIADIGRAGISSVGYRWPLLDTDDRSSTTQGRGGAISTIHRVEDIGHDAAGTDREALWQALSRFLRYVVPAAESAGVSLIYRTDVALGALPRDQRILDTANELGRLLDIAAAPALGLDLDFGFVTAVLGIPVEEAIRHFGSRGALSALRVSYLRVADGCAQEFFVDEDSQAMVRALRACREVGFEGALCPVAAPCMTDDSAWRHKGYAFGIGYLRGLLQVIG